MRGSRRSGCSGGLRPRQQEEEEGDRGKGKGEAVRQMQLWEMLGKKGDAYSQDIMELGLTLMSNQLSAPQAVVVLRAFLHAEYMHKKEGG